MPIAEVLVVAIPIVLNFVWNVFTKVKVAKRMSTDLWLDIFLDAFDATESAVTAGILKGDKWDVAWRIIRQLAIARGAKVTPKIEAWAKHESMVYSMQKKVVVNGVAAANH